MRVGSVELVGLLDGVESLAGPFASNFVLPDGADVDSEIAPWPALHAEDGRWRLHVWCFLLVAGKEHILVDTGVGQPGAPALDWFPAPGRVIEQLSARGVAVEAVDRVVLTHVHDDHIGGSVGADGKPAFPNARYVLQRAELEWRDAATRGDAGLGRIWDELVDRIAAAGQLDVVDGDVALTPEVGVRSMPGHTPGHQAVEIRSGGVRALMTGDVFHHPMQLRHPDWASTADDDLDRAARTRRALFDEAATQGLLLAPSHLSEPLGHVVSRGRGGLEWEPAPER